MIHVKRNAPGVAENPRVVLGYPHLESVTIMVSIFLIAMSLGACRHPPKEPVTLTFLDPQWAHDLTEHNVRADVRLQEFTQQTGIQVKHLPAPETALDQLSLMKELLRKGASSPDVVGVDVIWPGTLSDELIDLKPYFASELSSIDPHVVESFTVNGKLVAVPYQPDIGVLFYRKDLLREYGYSAPPGTWDELEKMATRIQQGERAKGRKDFWGFVWPGAAGEGLTCSALEWQVGDGGGHIIEADNTISVNNPDAIRSWERAAHWIGRISSPKVTSYEEWDAIYTYYLGNAAFFRGWAQSYSRKVQDNPSDVDWIGITNVPGGKAGHAATLGGFGLGVSRSSAHRVEAVELVRSLIGREIQSETARSHSEPSNRSELYARLAILKEYSDSADMGGGVVSRPSSIAKEKYADVARAYIRAVHSVLQGKTSAPETAAGLERELVGITGFKTKLPSQVLGPKD